MLWCPKVPCTFFFFSSCLVILSRPVFLKILSILMTHKHLLLETYAFSHCLVTIPFPNTCIFSMRHIADFLASRNTKQHFSTMLGGHFKQWNYHQKTQKCEKYFTEWTMKSTLTFSELKQEGKYYPVPPQLGTWDTRHSSCSAHVQECKVCADLEVTNTL